MAIYKVKPNQNLFDISLQLYGSVEGMFDLLITNEWLNMNTELETGMELEYHEEFIINQSIVNNLQEQNIVPSNNERHVYFKRPDDLVFVCGVDPILQHVSMVVGGEGDMIIDWGDNTELETISLSHTNCLVEHYFDSVVEARRIKVYGDFSMTYLDTSELGGAILLVRPLIVDEYRSISNEHSLSGLFLFEGTYKVNLQGCAIDNLLPIGNMNLQELDLSNVKFANVSVLDQYLQYIVEHYGTRRNCTVYLDTEPSEIGYEAINTILGEEEWNSTGTWQFIIKGITYQP